MDTWLIKWLYNQLTEQELENLTVLVNKEMNNNLTD